MRAGTRPGIAAKTLTSASARRQAAWNADAAITAIYAPPEPAPRETLRQPPAGLDAAGEAFARAVRNGDEHAIKFADTAAEVHARTGDPAALVAAAHAAALIPGQT